MNNSLEFSTYDEFSDGSSIWTEISGYNELNPNVPGDAVYALVDTTHGVSTTGNYILRHEAGSYYATQVSGDASAGFYKDGYSEQSTTLTDITGLTAEGNLPAPDAVQTGRN